jgi:thiol-disulfide isomerase/thioredoxin
VLLGVGLWLTTAAGAASPVGAAVPAGDAAVLFAATLADPQGQPQPMAAERGRVLLVNFWARWCGPCREEMPELVQLHQQFRGKGVRVLGIAVEDEAGPVAEFARKQGIDYPIRLAGSQGFSLLQGLGNSRMGLPFTLVIDRSGRISYQKLGRFNKNELAAALEAALAQR